MWDAIELYSELLASTGQIQSADLKEIKRKRFLQHFHAGDYRKAQCCEVPPELVILLFAELLPATETQKLLEWMLIKDPLEYL